MSSSGAWSPERFVAVAGGAAAGALCRALAGQHWPTDAGQLPLTTLLVNVAGCLVMGLLTPLLKHAHPIAGIALTTGFLGGFTTFSTFALDVERLTADHAGTMLEYAFLTVAGCVLAAAAGMVISRRALDALAPSPDDEPTRVAGGPTHRGTHR